MSPAAEIPAVGDHGPAFWAARRSGVLQSLPHASARPASSSGTKRSRSSGRDAIFLAFPSAPLAPHHEPIDGKIKSWTEEWEQHGEREQPGGARQRRWSSAGDLSVGRGEQRRGSVRASGAAASECYEEHEPARRKMRED